MIAHGTGRLSPVATMNTSWASYATEQLKAANEAIIARDMETWSVEVYARDRQGDVVGGLIGRTVSGWLEVGVPWVKEDLRGRGLGSRLPRWAERETWRRGCRAARLSAWDFQAPTFYARRGYVPYGQLDGYPPGHTVYYPRKDLTDPEVGQRHWCRKRS